ncbi:MAG: hypothetical protein LRS49_05285 [Desulfurococcales archaeon]|nr:hypothetical protein [Desulfurococcales archaeon]
MHLNRPRSLGVGGGEFSLAATRPGGGCPLEPPPRYGCESLLSASRVLRRLALASAAGHVAIALALLWLYTRGGDRGLLLGAALILALTPVDTMILYGLSSVARRSTLELLSTLLDLLGPEAYGVASRLGVVMVAARLPGGRLAVVVLESLNRATAVVLDSYTVKRLKPGKPWPGSLASALGLAGAARLGAARMAGELAALRGGGRPGGCRVYTREIPAGRTLILPDPEAPRLMEVEAARGRAAVASCPIRGGRSLAVAIAGSIG